ncbi:MAG: polysaccharide deacetylase family protein [Endomicrobia bacterium]|nr:polysaccharide deacetylase family protein [Endomicrobiia bacterium]MCL2507004.1 polysaccharide deacetylase family protein [Endomicrobiia bacterium]
MKQIIAMFLLLCVSVCFAENKIFYTDGDKNSKKIALTFDDGPGAATEKILEILKDKNVKATFFLLGSRVERKPELAKKVAEEGHEVQSHTYSHISFFAYKNEDKDEKMENELLKAQKSIEKNTGVKPYLVRFPYGYSKDDAKKVVEKNGYKIINWTFGCDWDRKLTADEMHKKYSGHIRNGAIFLMHDLNYNERLLSFLGDFIDEIKAKGYELVTVSELLDLKK